MVNLRFLFFIFIIFFNIMEASPYLDVSIDSSNSHAHFPMQGTITVTHENEEKIEPHAFSLEGKPLEVSLVKEVKMSASSNTIVSIYNFQLPGKEKGLYVLPVISIKINGKIYQTHPLSYEVYGGEEGLPTTPSPASHSPSSSIFRLEAIVDGPKTLYLGERTKLLYRISYNESVDLTRSVLPMVHPDHLRKIGDVHIEDTQLKETTIQTLTQEVEASEIGSFSFGPSLIEGYTYHMEGGQKIYSSTLLKAEAPPITIEVKPFPQSIEPPSFTGGLGNIQIQTQLESSHSFAIGETLSLTVAISGLTNLADFRLPPLECQPGFSGFFQISDAPPLSEIKEKTKFFHIELQPLTTLVANIPPIEVSSFDAKTHQYIIQKSTPIAVSIQAAPMPQIAANFPLPFIFTSSQKPWPNPSLPPLELQEMSAPQSIEMNWINLNTYFIGVILAIILLFTQKYLRKWKEKRPRPQTSKSEQLFEQGLKVKSLRLLEEAFWHRLWEKKVIPRLDIQLDKLPRKGKWESISSFIFYLQSLQYSTEKSYDFSKLKKSAKECFESI